MPVEWIESAEEDFPAPESAMLDPNGLLAAGGDLSPARLLRAYSRGIFPWYEEDQPILWWSPDPRLVLLPHELNVSRSLAKLARKAPFEISFDRDFSGVIQACAESRTEDTGTWITEDMEDAYIALHGLGFAHSVEAWQEGQLVGGLYGVALGGAFFGESMFSRKSNASKIALLHLIREIQPLGYELIDCQVSSDHLLSLGAREISRQSFLQMLAKLVPDSKDWTADSPPPSRWPTATVNRQNDEL